MKTKGISWQGFREHYQDCFDEWLARNPDIPETSRTPEMFNAWMMMQLLDIEMRRDELLMNALCQATFDPQEAT